MDRPSARSRPVVGRSLRRRIATRLLRLTRLLELLGLVGVHVYFEEALGVRVVEEFRGRFLAEVQVVGEHLQCACEHESVAQNDEREHRACAGNHDQAVHVRRRARSLLCVAARTR